MLSRPIVTYGLSIVIRVVAKKYYSTPDPVTLRSLHVKEEVCKDGAI